MKTITLKCRSCGKDLPEDSDPRRKYCPGTRCRQNFNEQLASEKKTMRSRASRIAVDSHNRSDPEIKEMKSRALEVLEDEIRDTMREVIKEQITPMIREKAQGAVVVMLDMLPKALARLQEDLDSRDAIARRNAVAIALRYTMPTVQENTKVESDTGINVYHWIPAPADTEVGRKVSEEMNYDADANYELFEEGWEVCQRCDTRTHPDNMTRDSNQIPVCTSCAIRGRIESGDSTPHAFLDAPIMK